MADNIAKSEDCRNDEKTITNYYKGISPAVKGLVESCMRDDCFHHLEPTPIPTQESAIRIINQTRRILFPGFFTQTRLDALNLEYNIGQEANELFERLSRQVILSIKHECLRYNQPCSQCIGGCAARAAFTAKRSTNLPI